MNKKIIFISAVLMRFSTCYAGPELDATPQGQPSAQSQSCPPAFKLCANKVSERLYQITPVRVRQKDYGEGCDVTAKAYRWAIEQCKKIGGPNTDLRSKTYKTIEEAKADMDEKDRARIEDYVFLNTQPIDLTIGRPDRENNRRGVKCADRIKLCEKATSLYDREITPVIVKGKDYGQGCDVPASSAGKAYVRCKQEKGIGGNIRWGSYSSIEEAKADMKKKDDERKEKHTFLNQEIDAVRWDFFRTLPLGKIFKKKGSRKIPQEAVQPQGSREEMAH